MRETEDVLAFVEKLLDKCRMIDELNLEEQRELVKALFKRIKWNSETESLAFVFISDDDDGDDDSDDGGDDDDDGGDMDDSDGGDDAVYKYASLEAVIAGDEMSQFNQSRSDVVRDYD